MAFGLNICLAQNTQIVVKPTVKNMGVILSTTEPYIDIEGYDGDDILIEMVARAQNIIPKEATGLKRIPTGKKDNEANILNTKIQENKRLTNITITLPACNCERVKIKVPKNPVLYVQPQFFGREGKLAIKNINNEVQIGGWMPVIELSHIKGFLLSTGGAHPGRRLADKIIITDVQWSNEPVRLSDFVRPRDYTIGANNASIYLSIPDSLKANVVFRSKFGQVFSDLGVASVPVTNELLKPYEDPFHKEAGFKALQLNGGGGLNMDIHSQSGNIYFIKQK